ncbi:hypothetical protein IWZ03DRAFT_206153 [Phyllosticta citriasiana]|uniref:Uncharacterized protein n=1 Tax=Phyllosticta citriasiana TaxID=595635 RepID=A0ABR1KKC7_9PEZI
MVEVPLVRFISCVPAVTDACCGSLLLFFFACLSVVKSKLSALVRHECSPGAAAAPKNHCLSSASLEILSFLAPDAVLPQLMNSIQMDFGKLWFHYCYVDTRLYARFTLHRQRRADSFVSDGRPASALGALGRSIV